jgi:hypothetical protein
MEWTRAVPVVLAAVFALALAACGGGEEGEEGENTCNSYSECFEHESSKGAANYAFEHCDDICDVSHDGETNADCVAAYADRGVTDTAAVQVHCDAVAPP